MPRLSPWQPPAAVPETLDADALVARLATVPRLREHHLWEALRILPSLGKAREDIGFRRAFRMLMERDDLDGACRALIAAACPARRLDRLQALDGVWVARVVLQEDAPAAPSRCMATGSPPFWPPWWRSIAPPPQNT